MPKTTESKAVTPASATPAPAIRPTKKAATDNRKANFAKVDTVHGAVRAFIQKEVLPNVTDPKAREHVEEFMYASPMIDKPRTKGSKLKLEPAGTGYVGAEAFPPGTPIGEGTGVTLAYPAIWYGMERQDPEEMFIWGLRAFAQYMGAARYRSLEQAGVEDKLAVTQAKNAANEAATLVRLTSPNRNGLPTEHLAKALPAIVEKMPEAAKVHVEQFDAEAAKKQAQKAGVVPREQGHFGPPRGAIVCSLDHGKDGCRFQSRSIKLPVFDEKGELVKSYERKVLEISSKEAFQTLIDLYGSKKQLLEGLFDKVGPGRCPDCGSKLKIREPGQRFTSRKSGAATVRKAAAAKPIDAEGIDAPTPEELEELATELEKAAEQG